MIATDGSRIHRVLNLPTLEPHYPDDTSLSADQFPDTSAFTAGKLSATIHDAHAFLRQLKIVLSINKAYKNKAPDCFLSLGENSFISLRNDKLGLSYKCDIKCTTRNPIQFIMNPDYLIDALVTIEQTKLTLDLEFTYTDNKSAFYFKHPLNPNYEAVIMPMKILADYEALISSPAS